MRSRSHSLQASLRLLALSLVLGLVGTFIAPWSAFAYNATGCRWSNPNVTVDIRYVNGPYRTAINQAFADYSGMTDAKLAGIDSSGLGLRAENGSYGATGWEGQASNLVCPFWRFYSVTIRLNTYYLPAPGTPVERLRVVWLHELGHALGLDHVPESNRVMYSSASQAYSNGVRYLTFDEVNGINAIY